MPFCPKCGGEITYLVSEVVNSTILLCAVELDGDGKLTFKDSDVTSKGRSGYRCPLCRAELFDNLADAVNFLGGNLEAHLKALGRVDKGRE